MPNRHPTSAAATIRSTETCCRALCSVIFEVRHDPEGEYYHLVTAWKATTQEEQSYAENV
jgi:hypothetical protein